ncbi:metallophosphoesterase [Alteromonas macleodii]|uniref:Calcineurin-like phosphoesterase domain-containing protein n=1 Tax=Alteromonas macleodii TaxID=28108 RepID=A0A6T9XUM4_ALTMA|nr:metallophosphoesterase [Alteromonas macleodii]CAB9492356.1 conserved protein of unknown function [Alteromonas macleodii]
MESNTSIFCISDIHISAQNHKNVLEKLSKAISMIKKFKVENKILNCVTIFAGDIAFSGNTTEYDLISPKIEELRLISKVVFCPGNHDHNFSQYEGSIRSILLASKQYDESVIKTASEGMREYRDFEEKFASDALESQNLLSKTYKIDNELYIHSLNTAWCSTLKESAGELHFPLDQMPKAEAGKVNLVFFHHPFSWLNLENSKGFRNELKENFQIVISGHEHEHDDFAIETDTTKALFIESVSFYSHREEVDGFFCITQENNDLKIDRFKLNEEEFEIFSTRRKSNILAEKGIRNKGAELSPSFSAFLSSLGTGFIHSEKKNLELDDIFIYPNLSVRINSKQTLKNKSSSQIESGALGNRLFLSGDENTGKTTLSKKVYKDYFTKGFFPVFIDGGAVKKSSKLNHSFIRGLVQEQYSKLPTADYFDENLNRVLIFDDFDKIKGSKTSIEEMMQFLNDNFDSIVIFVSDSYNLSEGIVTNIPSIGEYEWYDILNLGFKLRYELVNKWNTLKESCRECQDTLIKQNDFIIKTVNNVLGKNYIPANPFFLITVLQSMDEGSAADINTSSHGYYYQYLITSSLGLANIKKEELDEYFTYISHLSYFLHEQDIRSISVDEFNSFNKTFENIMGLSINISDRLKKLVNAKILNKDEDSVSFKYPYVYYFFLSNYLAQSIDDEKIRAEIEALIENVNDKKSASILMFLTHHSKNKVLIEKMLHRSARLFEEYTPTNLDMDSNFIDKIVKTLPDIKYLASQADSQENRLQHEERKDYLAEIHEDEDEEALASVEDEKEEIVDLIKQFGMTMKAVELLGQLSKNYYGSLPKELKTKLIKEAIEGPLRAIESIFVVVREHPEEAVKAVEANIKNTENNYTESEISKVATEALFGLLSTITYVFIRKIASSIGHKNLESIVREIMDEKKTNSSKLVYLSVLLDMGKFGSTDVVHRVIKSLEQNSISKLITQVLVRNYLYMFEVPDSKVQSLCKMAGLRYQTISSGIRLEKQQDKRLT